jgi:hypothetical protein
MLSPLLDTPSATFGARAFGVVTGGGVPVVDMPGVATASGVAVDDGEAAALCSGGAAPTKSPRGVATTCA